MNIVEEILDAGWHARYDITKKHPIWGHPEKPHSERVATSGRATVDLRGEGILVTINGHTDRWPTGYSPRQLQKHYSHLDAALD